MGQIRQFPANNSRAQVPTPHSYHPDNEYLLMEFDGEDQAVPVSFFPETKIIILVGRKASGNLHAIRTPDGTGLSRLNFRDDGKVMACALLEGSPHGLFEPSELDIIGYVDEIYPLGWRGTCALRYTQNTPTPHSLTASATR